MKNQPKYPVITDYNIDPTKLSLEKVYSMIGNDHEWIAQPINKTNSNDNTLSELMCNKIDVYTVEYEFSKNFKRNFNVMSPHIKVNKVNDSAHETNFAKKFTKFYFDITNSYQNIDIIDFCKIYKYITDLVENYFKVTKDAD